LKNYLPSPLSIKELAEVRNSLSFPQEKEGGLMLYSGLCKWKEGAGADGQPAIVPVKLFRAYKKTKKLLLLATYHTEADGKFYLVTKAIDDYYYDYMIGPVVSKAVNMPEKVKEFFKKKFKEQKESGPVG
jgi:hypothetical protein